MSSELCNFLTAAIVTKMFGLYCSHLATPILEISFSEISYPEYKSNYSVLSCFVLQIRINNSFFNPSNTNAKIFDPKSGLDVHFIGEYGVMWS